MRGRIPLFFVAAAFGTVVLAFVLSAIIVARVSSGNDPDALVISQLGAPGIRAISDARATVRLEEALTEKATVEASHGIPIDEAPIGLVRARLDAQVSAYARDPLPGSAPLLAALEEALRHFERACERAVRSGPGSIFEEVEPLADQLDGRAGELVDYGTRTVQEAANRIEHRRRLERRLYIGLGSLAVVVACFSAFFAMRALRSAEAAQQDHEQFLRDRADELEIFAGRVAHDILSPLGVAAMAFHLAGRDAKLTPEALIKGKASIQRVRIIVDGLLEFARAGARPEPNALSAVQPVLKALRDELDGFARERSAQLLVEPGPACAVKCSEGVLYSILANLLRNGIKYLGASQRREVMLRVHANGTRVCFEVEDTGPGIPEALTTRVFEPYVRGLSSAEPGIGLGLATVRRLAVAHGGSVLLMRGAAGGALFKVELPVEGPPPERA